MSLDLVYRRGTQKRLTRRRVKSHSLEYRLLQSNELQMLPKSLSLFEFIDQILWTRDQLGKTTSKTGIKPRPRISLAVK
jgi:hypothetical protein